MVDHASATQSSRAGWRYRERNRSYSGPTPKSLGVCAAFFCDQAQSNWHPVTSATQFHCPKLYSVRSGSCANLGETPGIGESPPNQPISGLVIFSKHQALSRPVVVNRNMSRGKFLAWEGPGSRLLLLTLLLLPIFYGFRQQGELSLIEGVSRK